jgi:mRNA interferase MazF
MKNAERGEVWIVDLGLAAKVRPCLVLSIPSEDEDRALVTLAPHTTSPRGSRFEVGIHLRFFSLAYLTHKTCKPFLEQSSCASLAN